MILVGAFVGAAAVVDVLGVRREAERDDRPGQTLLIRPEDPSRFDTAMQVSREASVTVPETGRVSASGFAVPHVRGQDARLTEVYVEDLPLSDPYSGLPLVDEIDLRAFGELVIHEGVPPPDLPSLGPGGVLQYKLTPIKGSGVTGITYGRPYGMSGWLLLQADGAEHDRRGGASAPSGADVRPWFVRVYARRHVTDGRYEYYSDNATPYNTTDDSYRIRHDNQRNSTQLVPVATGPLAGGQAEVLGLFQDSATGLPALAAGVDSHAEQKAKTWVTTARWQRSIFELGVAANHDERDSHDPSHAVLGVYGSNQFQVDGGRLRAAVAWSGLHAEVEEAQVNVSATSASNPPLKVTREATRAYAGAEWSPVRPLSVELKALGEWNGDRFKSGGSTDALATPPTGTRRAYVPGETAAAQWSFGLVSTYVQGAHVVRAPSLMEEFGDGALIRTSADIRPETVFHREAGVNVRNAVGTAHAGAAVFQDDTEDRIVLIPSLAQSLRAVNVGETRVQGFELRGNVTVGGTAFEASATRLDPEDRTNPAHTTILPGIAERQAALGLAQRLGPVTARWDARYRSQVYRDLSDTIVVPECWIHDASLDGHVSLLGHEASAGLSVLNVFNVEKLPVSAPATPENRGETAYSDLAGYPLPGRQVRISLAFQL